MSTVSNSRFRSTNALAGRETGVRERGIVEVFLFGLNGSLFGPKRKNLPKKNCPKETTPGKIAVKTGSHAQMPAQTFGFDKINVFFAILTGYPATSAIAGHAAKLSKMPISKQPQPPPVPPSWSILSR